MQDETEPDFVYFDVVAGSDYAGRDWHQGYVKRLGWWVVAEEQSW